MTGKQIRKLRKRLDLNQHQLAILANVSQTSVSLVETDGRVSQQTLDRILNALRKRAQEDDAQPLLVA